MFSNEYVCRSTGPIVAGRAVRLTKALVMRLMWSTTPVPVNGATFRPDHIVLLAKRPAGLRPHAVIDVNGSTATCDYDRYAASNDDVNVAVLSTNCGSP